MRAAIYARYSSENQRPESIEDQISACRRLGAERGYAVDEALIFTDAAASGARKDRVGLRPAKRSDSTFSSWTTSLVSRETHS
jgi:DNA invertase Pin-like site-specific DNA recombinase